MPDLRKDKSSLRERFKHIRDAIDPTERAAWSSAIHKRLMELEVIRSSHSFFVYVSTAGEVSTHALIDALVAQHKSVAIPLVSDRTHMQAKRFPG